MNKPVLIFDGDCNFCRRWIERWKCLTADQVEYYPYQEVKEQYPQITPEQASQSVQLLEGEKVFRGAEAVFRTLAYNKSRGLWLWFYQKLPGFKSFTEFFYRLVARNRVLFSKITKLLWGNQLAPSTYFQTRSIFIKGLALIYLIAFVSLGVQWLGLVGEQGIIPAQEHLKWMRQEVGIERYFYFPTLAWISSSNTALTSFWIAGSFFSVLLLLGLAPMLCLLVLWVLYLSMVTIGGAFLSFQWDNLLLEVGLLAIFFAPSGWRPGLGLQSKPPTIIRCLLWWLLFRLMFASGVVKLMSGDPTWHLLMALDFHYYTQPIPTWTSWYAHHLPEWFHRVSVILMFVIELVVPFLLILPRRIRFFAAWNLIFLQILILATGNYCFFNWLTILLCLLLFDDAAWQSLFRTWKPKGEISRGRGQVLRHVFIYPLVVLILLVSTHQMFRTFQVRIPWPKVAQELIMSTRPFRSINSYGLFARMTTDRPEIIVEGSYDGEEWKAYEFKHKPGKLDRAPSFVAPHQPRLDWQMWFAALGHYSRNQWFINFCVRLLRPNPEVLGLIETNPFTEKPPNFIRATVYDYEFTDPDEKKNSGKWWKRVKRGLYLPVVSLPK